jgi:hypothetical protein
MADKFKVLASGTANYAQLKDGITLINNDASTSVMVTELSATFTKQDQSKSVTLSNGGVDVLQASSSANIQASGKEFVGENESLTLSTDDLLFFTNAQWFGSTTGLATATPTNMLVDPTGSTSVTTASTTISAAVPTVADTTLLFKFGNDYYFHNTASSGLYKRTGGINGAQTMPVSVGFAWCWDQGELCYGVDATYIYTYNLTTGVLTQVLYTWPNASTQLPPSNSLSRIFTCDGIVGISGNQNSSFPNRFTRLYKPDVGGLPISHPTLITSVGAVPTQSTLMVKYKDKYYLFNAYLYSHSTIFQSAFYCNEVIFNADKTSATFRAIITKFTAQNSVSTNLDVYRSDFYHGKFYGKDDYRYVLLQYSTTRNITEIVDLENITLKESITISGITLDAAKYYEVDPTVEQNAFGELNYRVVGIETTV